MNGAGDPHPTRSLLVLSYVALSFALAQTTVLPALPRLIAGLHTTANDVTWTLTSYFICAAVSTPVLGRLGDMFGKRKLLVVSMGAFGVGALVSAVASDLWIVVAGRGLQGLGGAVFPLCFGMARDLFPPALVPRSVGVISAMTGTGGSLGLIGGGLIVDNASWHWIFWLSAIMGISSAVAARVLLRESTVRSGGRVDMRGAIVLGIGLALVLFAISRIASWGWANPSTAGCVLVGAFVLAAWVALERRTVDPLVNIELLSSPRVLLTNLATLFSGMGMMGIYVVVPQLAQAATSTGYGFGLGATGAGLLLFPGSVLMMALGPVSAAIGSRVGDKVPFAIGSLVAAVSLAVLGFAHGSETDILVLGAFAFGGVGLSFAAMPNLIIDSVAAEQTGEATAFNFVVLRAGSSLGAQLGATILAGSVAAGATLPTDAGYTTAFFVCAAAALACTVTATRIPRAAPRHAPHLPGEVVAGAPLAGASAAPKTT